MLDRDTVTGQEVARFEVSKTSKRNFLECLARAKTVADDKDFLLCLDRAMVLFE